MLTERYKHLYFPIDWNKANSRSIAYLLRTNHDLVCNKLHEYGFKGELVELTHTRLSGNTFRVNAWVLPKDQWVLFLLLFKNSLRLKILYQLQLGITLNNVILD